MSKTDRWCDINLQEKIDRAFPKGWHDKMRAIQDARNKKTTRLSELRNKVRLEARVHCGQECELCGDAGKLHVHHIRHLSKGGTNKIENLVTLCISCHRKEHKNLPDKFFKEE